MESHALQAVLAFAVSLVSGYLGIGGGILMAPALLYLPPLLGVGQIPIRDVTGLTIAQGLLACLSGAWRHGRHGFLDRELVLWVGSGLIPSALAGSLLSSLVSGRILEGMLAVLALVAAVLALVPRGADATAPERCAFCRASALLLGGVVGFVCGMLGQGGSFLLVPAMIALLGVPTRFALGSNLALVFLASISGFVGKCVTGQVTAAGTLAVALGAVPGAQLGSLFSHRTAPRALRMTLAVLVGAIGLMLARSALFHGS